MKKETLIETRNYLKQFICKENLISIKECSLDSKLKKFNEWCYKNKIKSKYTNIGEFQNRNIYMDFIEKMAIWYELRYPWFRVINLFGQETKTDIFENIDWNDFYNFNMFKACLDPIEYSYLRKPEYPDLVYIQTTPNPAAHLHLSPEGIITDCEFYNITVQNKLKNKLIGKHIKESLDIFKENNIELPRQNGIESAIFDYEVDCYFKEELLNCVMYRIIQRDGKRIGPRRAFLFAKEFNRNIDIPLKYGIDTSDPYLYKLIIEYLKLGGKTDLECYENYFRVKSETDKLEIINLKEIIDIELSELMSKQYEEDYLTLKELITSEKQLIKK